MLSRSSCIGLFATPWAVVVRLLCPRGFSRQEYWSGLPCPPPGYLSNPGIEPRCPILQGDSLPSAPPGKPQIYKSDLVYGFSDWEVFNYWFNLVSHSSCFDLLFFFLDSFFCHPLSQVFVLVLCHLGFADTSSPASPFVPLTWVLSICRPGAPAKTNVYKLEEWYFWP